MTPIEYIRRGIINRNWNDVAEALKLLTGEIIEITEDIDKLTQLRTLFRKIFDITYPEVNVKIDGYCQKHSPPPFSPPNNQPITEIEDKNITPMKKESNGIKFITNADEKSPDIPKRERKVRPNPRSYEVKCNECDQNFKSNRPESDIGQKCQRCLNNKS